MAEPETDFRAYAGMVAFPRGPGDLTSTTSCPACFSALRGEVCPACGLDLGNPAATELAATSSHAAALLDRRLDLIGRIRFETAQTLAARRSTAAAFAAAAPVLSAPAHEAVPVPESLGAVPSAPPVSSPTTPSGPSGPPAPRVGHAPASPTAPRRSGVQVILLVVGISLLSVAAIFFLVYAFINFGILGRSLIIGAITVAAFAVASLLRRRELTATAEGIAVLAVVLAYLDVYAVRANDFFGLGASNGELYWGVALVSTAVLFVGWNRLSGLRTASVVGFAALAPGAGLLVSGWGERTDDATRTVFALGAVAVAGLAHVAAGRRGTPTRRGFAGTPERVILLSSASLALVAAFAASFALPGADAWTSAAAIAALSVIALLHVVALDLATPGRAGSKAFGAVFAVLGGVLSASVVASTVIRGVDERVAVIAPAVAAVTVALLFELLSRRGPLALALNSRTAAVAAAVIAAITGLVPVYSAAIGTILPVTSALLGAWTVGPTAVISRLDHHLGLAVLALASIGVIAAGFWTLGRSLRGRAAVLASFAATIAVLAVPLLSVLWLVLAGWLLLAAVSLALLVLAPGRPLVARVGRVPLVGALAASTALAYLVGWASTGTWLAASIAVILLLLAARGIPRTASPPATAGRAALLGTAVGVALIGSAALARQLALDGAPSAAVDLLNLSRAVEIAAIVLLGLATFVRGRLVSEVDRRTVFWMSIVAAGGFATVARVAFAAPGGDRGLLLAEPATGLVANSLLFAALVVWVALPTLSVLRIERIVASIALGPALLLVVDSFAHVLNLPEFALAVVPITSAVLASAGGLAVAMLRPASPRWPREVGIGLVGLPALARAVLDREESGWLVLVLAAVAALLLATGRDGLFASRSPRRQVGWVALALATAGLWWHLADDRVLGLEPYVLPVAGALLLIALLVWQAEPREPHDTPSRSAPLIALGGLLVAILPLGLDAATGGAVRALVLGAVSAALLLVGSVVLGVTTVRPYLDAAAVAGAIGVIVVTTGRSIAIALEPGSASAVLDGWLIGGMLLLVAAAFGQARVRGDSHDEIRSVASQALGIIAMTSTLLIELSVLSADLLGPLRALSLVLLFAALHVIAFLVNRSPFSRAVGWLAIAYAAVAGIGGVASGALDSIELASVPVALALLATGATVLAGSPAARSWAWLAPGVSVLLVPSLLATAVDAPLWRLVGLGVASVAVVIGGVRWRLQAPFLIGAVVAIVHAIATFAPQIRLVYESVEWWLWLAVGGVIIVVISARFERSMRSLATLATRIRSLR
ncbi:SCO7613 C-terminal domain-containing membrane protein [Lacisediminihabitans sp.]|uniref:SCO7613 C-terminal domain-containing membrane protein n=1 Tax=Lacisediminihabitans sp. TaxID=2787631 RepID=UPI00374D4B2C